MQEVDKLSILRHSAAHLLAQAVKELYPDTKLTIGPATKTGFFYDFQPTQNFKEEDLTKIEQRMHELSKKNLPITHEEISKDKALKLYKDNPFKRELIEGIPGDTVGLSRQGDFYDLCRGGHVASTGDIKHFKLESVSGSYWRANRDNAPLQRIYGTAFFTAKDLRTYERRKIEAAKYDHRKLGKELDLFSFHKEGAGLPFFHAKGLTIIRQMQKYIYDKLFKTGWKEIRTPVLLSDDLWKQSGHYDHYKDNMFFCNSQHETYAVKPMNCPGAILLYSERPRSYRELPLRFAEDGLVHRYELSGVLHGLFRVRGFTQDDGHIFCTVDQLEDEIASEIKTTYEVLKTFDFDNVHVALSTRPEKSMGSPELWDKATNALKHALERAGVKYTIQEGEGAFYGPKIEFLIEDSMGREWQVSTIQVDFFQAHNFDLTYVAPDGSKQRPVMIHRAIYGSYERFLGILLEHYKGKLPFWLSPVQIKVLTITDDQKEYAQKITQELRKHKIRAEFDTSSDPINGKIKNAQKQQIPWMLIIGQKEVDNNTVSIRYRDGKQEFGLELDTVLQKAHESMPKE